MAARRLVQRVERGPFGGASLPLTMELANLAKSVLEPELVAVPAEWSLEYRVLVHLVPSLRDDVETFYGAGGSDLAETFPDRVARMDNALVGELMGRISARSPQWAAALLLASGEAKGGTTK